MISNAFLFQDLVPSAQPPTQISDPNDRKPDDWSEEEYIDDLTAIKPDDWDESAPAEILDEDAVSSCAVKLIIFFADKTQ